MSAAVDTKPRCLIGEFLQEFKTPPASGAFIFVKWQAIPPLLNCRYSNPCNFNRQAVSRRMGNFLTPVEFLGQPGKIIFASLLVCIDKSNLCTVIYQPNLQVNAFRSY